MPPSAARVQHALAQAWPRLSGRVTFVSARLEDVPLSQADLVVSSHACGHLTDVVLERALGARARVAVLPCCHDIARACAGDLAGWVDPALAIDITRAVRLRQQGYDVQTLKIPEPITPKNRLLLGAPSAVAGDHPAADFVNGKITS